jgi:hypothetical protein
MIRSARRRTQSQAAEHRPSHRAASAYTATQKHAKAAARKVVSASSSRGAHGQREWEVARCVAGARTEQDQEGSDIATTDAAAAPAAPASAAAPGPRFGEEGDMLPITSEEAMAAASLCSSSSSSSYVAKSLALSRVAPGEGVGFYRGWFTHTDLRAVGIGWGRLLVPSSRSPCSPRNHEHFLIYATAGASPSASLLSWSREFERDVLSGRMDKQGYTLAQLLEGDVAAVAGAGEVYIYVR